MSEALELSKKLDVEFDRPELTIENAIAVYKDAAAKISRLNEVKNLAKKEIEQVIIETGKSNWATSSGSCTMTKPNVSVRYDSKALDMLCKANSELSNMLRPFRIESERAGTLRITSK